MLILLSFSIGKNQLFLLFNGNGGFLADLFFTYCTYLGDGIIWVPVALLFIFFRKKLLPLVFSAIIISTLLVQVSKNVVFPNEARPTNAIQEINLIHTVKGVELHSNNSFPSGHTTTVFCIYLLGCLVIGGNTMLIVGLIFALLTGYSRIYLAQHFPLDVGAGMITAVISIYISLWIQRLFNKRQNAEVK
ncbi:MAG: phosphatase PAP2 family protein [Sphingobacteriia bacterium]|jgi:membrane-associated phospholipid phosphatase